MTVTDNVALTANKYFSPRFGIVVFFLYSMYINNYIRMKTKTTSRSRRKTSYTAVSNNVYFDGSSYRVRASVNGTKFSKNFSSRKQAIAYRNQILG